MAEQLVTMNLQVDNPNEAVALFGTQDANLRRIEQEMNVSIVTRGETVSVSGDAEAVKVVE